MATLFFFAWSQLFPIGAYAASLPQAPADGSLPLITTATDSYVQQALLAAAAAAAASPASVPAPAETATAAIAHKSKRRASTAIAPEPLSGLLKSLQAAVREAEASRGAKSAGKQRKVGPTLAARKALLQPLHEQLQASGEESRKALQQTSAHIAKHALPTRIAERHAAVAAQHAARLAELQKSLAAIEAAGSEREFERSLARAAELLESRKSVAPQAPVSSPRPFRVPAGVARAPRTRAAAADVLDTKAMVADAGDAWLGLAASALGLPGPQDLAETPDVTLTPAIRACAAALHDNPFEIFSWVHDEIDFVASHGSIQGAAQALQTGQANAQDTASLLIALLRAAGIPARYVYGTVEATAASVQAWLGVRQPETAVNLLRQGGIAAELVTLGGSAPLIRFEHVWVEAFVDFYPSRGVKNLQADAWIPMDASFKAIAAVAGMDLAALASADAYGLMRQLEAGASIDPVQGRVSGVDGDALRDALLGYQQALDDAIMRVAPDATVGAVLGTRHTAAFDGDGLAATLPYVIVYSEPAVATIDDARRHQFRIALHASATDRAAGAPMLALQQSLPALAGQRLTLSFTPASADDQAALDSYFPQAHADGSPVAASEYPDAIPGYLVELRAELRLDGDIVASGGQLPLGTPILITTDLFDPASASWTPAADESLFAGEYQVLAFDGSGVGSAELAAIGERLAGVRAQLAAGALGTLSRDATTGDLLRNVALGYFALAGGFASLYQRAAGVVTYRQPSVARAVAEVAPRFEFGVPTQVRFPGVALRVDALAASAAGIDSTAAGAAARALAFQKQTLERGSANAHLILENIFSAGAQGAPGVSAIKALSAALAAGQSLHVLDAANVAAVLPQLQLPAGAKREIEDAANAGWIGVAADVPLTLGAWTGSGYIVADNQTGAGAYRLAEGGATAVLHAAAGMPWLALARPDQQTGALPPALDAAVRFDEAQAARLASADDVRWGDFELGRELSGGLFLGLLIGIDAPAPLAWAVDVQATDAGTSAAGALNEANRAPLFTTSPITTASANRAYRYPASAADPDGNPISFLVEQAPTGLAISATGLVAWDLPVEGSWPVVLRVADGKSYTRQAYTLKVGPEPAPLALNLSIAPTIVNPGQALTITLSTSGGSGNIARGLRVNDADVALDATGRAVITPAAPGAYRVVATAADDERSVSRVSQFGVRDAADTSAPTVQILSPAADSEVTAPVTVSGTASDNVALTQYRLRIRPSGGSDSAWRDIASGQAPVTNGLLGTLDPTTLENGLYELGLIATDANGLVATTQTPIEVTRELKIGQFSLAFEDLNVEAAGIPIRVTRTYDTRRKHEKLDFGYGWTVDSQSLRLRKNIVVGLAWQQYNPGGFQLCVRPAGKHKITITLPDGKQERFEAVQTPECATGQVPAVNISFRPLPGTTSTLTVENLPPNLKFQGGQIYDMDLGGPFDPLTYKLTTEDRYVYVLEDGKGIRNVRDPFGNELTYTANGITHSDGRSIPFTRDAQGRIAKITDPAGKAILYAYDAAGNLTSVTDREGRITTLAYNGEHGLTDYTDPRGIRVAKQVYDDSGRLVATIDAQGNRTEVTHDTDNSLEVVQDRNGNQTRYRYDAAGNVTEKIDALGHATTYAYDALGNETSVTDALGNTITRIFDPIKGKLLKETDPEGNVTEYTYKADGQPATTKDPRGNLTSYSYLQINGRPLAITEPLGRVSGFGYDASGNLKQLTIAGETTEYTYDAKGNRIAEKDAGGHASSYAFDANGRETKKAWTRNLPGGGSRVLSESYSYDAEGRRIASSNTLGHRTQTLYNAAGKPVEEIDALGRSTTYTYDERLNLVRTTYPDGSSEATDYDREGNAVAQTDRDGRTTRTEYDALNRPIRIIQPDGSSTSTAYDAAGRVASETDARGNTTIHAYDAAGRLTGITNALNQTTRYGYDANGNRTSATDPLNRTTRFDYDALNRLVKTIHPDQSQSLITWTLQGRKESETDPSGNVTRFGYDAKGQLTSVTQILDGRELVTRYTYDESGNKLTQQDASGNITRWAFDDAGRQIARTLPLGQTETFEYDANGNLRKHTDFQGRTSVHGYDTANRPTLKAGADGSKLTTTYDEGGQVASQAQAPASGTARADRYAYDAQQRLARIERSEGTLSYQYDRNGNRTRLTTPGGTVSYQYDELNRLASLTDPRGRQTTYQYDEAGNKIRVSYPNDTTIEYAYDVNNRLTEVRHRKTSDGAEIAAFHYTLAPNGQRTKLEERDGAGPTQTLDYEYDSLLRLTRETRTNHRTGAVATTSWGLDETGNRLSQTVSIEPPTSSGQASSTTVTTYTYDANDRLLTETQSPSPASGGGSGVGAVSKTYTYDASGNTTSVTATEASGTTNVEYLWDNDNRLVGLKKDGVTVASFAYDADGIRTQKRVEGQAPILFLVDPNQAYAQVVEENDAVGTPAEAAYVYGDDLITLLRGGQGSYYHPDGLGSTRALTNDYGVATDAYSFEAYGELLAKAGTTENSYLYTGEQFDADLRLQYLRARFFDGGSGRFRSADVFQGRRADPASLHRYAYAQGNPISSSDPSGYYATLVGQVSTVSGLGMSMVIGLTIAATAVAITSYEHAHTRQRAKADAIACAASIAMTAISTFSPCGLNPYPMVFMRLNVIPTITEHMAASQAAGSPNVLTRNANPLGTVANRIIAMGKCALGLTILPSGGTSCDEYPFASTNEGGVGATVRFVPWWEQLSQGGTLSSFYGLCGINPFVPGLNDFLAVPVISAPRSFSCGRFAR